MRIFSTFFALFLFLSAGFPAQAAVEGGYDPEKPRAVTPWYGGTDAASRTADLDFIKGMRPHHAGALTMSAQYLGDRKASNASLKQLARGIIRNQEFEILMLDTVERHISRSKGAYEQIATGSLAQRHKFQRAPMPGFLDALAQPRAVTARDVQFAKAMIIHHQGALDMAQAYLEDPAAHNGYLRLMCLDILTDQKQEIAFMEKTIAAYPGDAGKIRVDSSMIHGMEGMKHIEKHRAQDSSTHHH